MASSSNLRLQTILRHLSATGATPTRNIACQQVRNVSSFDAASFRRYEYTLDDTILTNSQRQSYEDNGFFVVKKLVPDHFLDNYCQRFIDIADGNVPAHGMTVMKDTALKKTGAKGEHYVYKIQDFSFDDVLFEYCCLPQILEYVQCFTGPNTMAMHTMLINKPPDTGTLSSRHPLHQDLHYFPFRPANSIVCSWTAMEKVNRQNGCLVAIPGSHKGELIAHDYPDWEGGVNKAFHGITSFSEDLQRSYLEMEKGDTVFFHPLLIHGSGANRTTGYRKAISCHYAAAECEYIDVSGTTQENLAQEVLDMAARRGIQLESFKDAWHYRSRLVTGHKVNL